MRPRIFVSYSMGKSSAEMCRRVKRKYDATHDTIYGCANTSGELLESIEFGRKVDDHLGLNCVLLEAVVHHGERKSSSHRVVSWETATMDASVFEEVIKKYGIPNQKWLHCTRELKTRPMTSYLESVGWEWGSYKVAIGYRADEKFRVPKNFEALHQFYPLIDEGVTKEDIYRIFATEWPFTLELEEHEGNCMFCFKKNIRKLLTIMKLHPERFAFPERMQQLHGRTGAEFLKDPAAPDRRWYRGNRSVDDLRREAAMPFDEFVDELYKKHFDVFADDPMHDLEERCRESCEPFMEDAE